MKTLRAFLLLSLLGVVFGLSLTACDLGEPLVIDLPCPPDAGPELAPYCPPDAGQGGAGGAGGEGGAGGTGGTAFCPGPCIPTVPGDWSTPTPQWIGDSAQVPSDCAAVGGSPYFFFANPFSAPLVCGQCGCGTPTGDCSPTPKENWVSTAADCNPNGTKTQLALPPNWDGSCTNENALPKDLNCNGTPCARSLYIGELYPPKETCEGILTGAEPKPPIEWDTGILECTQPPMAKDINAVCGDDNSICGRHLPPPYRYCTTHTGNVECPANTPFTAKRVLAVPKDGIIDNRACICECGIENEGICSTNFHIYAGPNCTNELFYDPISSAPLMAQCDNLIPIGTSIGSRSVDPLLYAPGTCKLSKEGTTGSIQLDLGRAFTICCREEPYE